VALSSPSDSNLSANSRTFISIWRNFPLMASSNLILIVALFSVLGLASVNVDEVVDPCEESSFSHLDAVPFCSHLDPLRGLSSSMGIPSRSSIGAPSISSSAPSSFFLSSASLLSNVAKKPSIMDCCHKDHFSQALKTLNTLSLCEN